MAFQLAREKVFTAFSPKATKKLAKSNMWVNIHMLYMFSPTIVLTNSFLGHSLVFTDDQPFLWKPQPVNFGPLRTIPPTVETELPFVSVSIPSIHPDPIFKPHYWVSSHDAASAPPMAFHKIGGYENGVFQYRFESLMPMNEADWREMARESHNQRLLPSAYVECSIGPLKFNF
jgi:hypothetical protein